MMVLFLIRQYFRNQNAALIWCIIMAEATVSRVARMRVVFDIEVLAYGEECFVCACVNNTLFKLTYCFLISRHHCLFLLQVILE
jgi:hypothetical protein